MHGLQVLLFEHSVPVLSDEYSVYVKHKNTMSAVPEVAIVLAEASHDTASAFKLASYQVNRKNQSDEN